MYRRELVHFSEKRTFTPGLGVLLLAFAASHSFAVEAGDAAGTEQQVLALLDSAEAAERRGHLIYPSRGSAMSLYHEVLYLQPDNPFALEGLARLAEQHLEAAQAALAQGQLIKADSQLSKARMIYPDYPPVDAMSHQLKLLETARRTRETLDWRLVRDRSASLHGQLNRLGGVAKSGDCRVKISVSNDSEGRWIYQRMNQASGSQRLRAEVQIASPAAVEILCFQAPEDDA